VATSLAGLSIAALAVRRPIKEPSLSRSPPVHSDRVPKSYCLLVDVLLAVANHNALVVLAYALA
jgi:hypothetical protein